MLFFGRSIPRWDLLRGRALCRREDCAVTVLSEEFAVRKRGMFPQVVRTSES